MYCQNCGTQLEESALTCTQCGRAVGAPPPPPQYQYQQPYPQPPYPQPYPPPYQQGYQQQPALGTNTLALVGFILTLFPFVPFAGLALCIAGLSQCKRTGQQGSGLAAAGTVINIAGFVLAILGALLFFVFFARTGFDLSQDWMEEFAYTVLR
jgi:hypothetical protein